MGDPFRRPSLGSGVFYRDPWAALDWLEKAFGFERSMVISDQDGRLADFIPVGLDEDAITHIAHWPEGRGLLGLLISDSRPLRRISRSTEWRAV